MKFKPIDDKYIEDNLLNGILERRGVEDIESLINVNIKDTHDYKKLKYIDKGIDLYFEAINNDKYIYIQVDSDVDGMTSSALIYNYTKVKYPNVKILWNIHKGKEHGIKASQIPSNIGLVIIPDAGCNDLEEFKLLNERGVKVLVLDHHMIEHENKPMKDTVIINCKDGKYPNKNLSGVGVVYKFCKALDDRLGINIADNYLDLVAVGMIGDVMDLKELETRYYCQEGLGRIQNKFIKAIINNDSAMKEKEKINILNVGWNIAPLINGTIRGGTMQEKIDMFMAFIEKEGKTFEYKKRGATEPIVQNIYDGMARICGNIKNRQNNRIKEQLKIIEKEISCNKDILNGKIIIIDVTDKLDKTFTGLVANKLSEKYKRPVLLLRSTDKENNYYGGSARNFSRFEIKQLKTFLLTTEQFEWCQGHENSFGFEIHKNNIEKLKYIINEKLKNVELDSCYEVDMIKEIKKLNKKDILEVGKHEDVWGSGISEPLFAITDIKLNDKDVSLLGKNNVIKFKSNDIDFIKLFTNKTTFEELTLKDKNNFGSKNLIVDIVGKFKINKYNGQEKPQIEIIDFNVKEDKTFVF